MKNAALLFGLLLSGTMLHAQVYTQTYSLGDIYGVSDVQTSTTQTSQCPGSLTFTSLPAGAIVDSVRVTYDFFSTLAGFQSPLDQRSYIRCTTTGISESTLALANLSGPGSTIANYSRLVTVANGPLTSTSLTFELHAGTTAFIPGSCTGSGHIVMNNTWTVTVYTSGAASCPAPSGLAAVATSPNSVTLDWTPGGSETQWEIQYGLANLAGTIYTSAVANSHPFTIPNLDSASVYEFMVRAVCGSADSSLFDGPLVAETDTPVCTTPSNISVGSITQDEASVSWTQSGFSIDWQIEYGLQGFVPGSGAGTQIVGAQSNPWLLTGLTPNTVYDVYVRNNCGLNTSDFVGPESFETLASDIGLMEVAAAVSLFPNPTHGPLNVRVAVPMDFEIYHISGARVLSGRLNAGINSIRLDAAPGWYFLSTPESTQRFLVKGR